MRRAILLLSLLLLLQLGLALGLRLGGRGASADAGGGKLLDMARNDIDRLNIDGGDQGSLELRKIDGKWTLPGHLGAPADPQKVDALLSDLLSIERPWPVARTGDAIKRFKVADGTFERRLEFKSGDRDLATLLIGASPGFRKVHARLSGEQKVFDIPFSVYQASVKAADWVDGSQLQLKSDRISAIDLPDCRLIRENGQPKVADLTDTERTDGKKAGRIFDRLAGLSIQDVYEKADQPLPGPVELSIGVELTDGTKRRYDFALGVGENTALLKVSGAPYLYQVAGSLLKDLKETTRSKLVQAGNTAVPLSGSPKAPSSSPKTPG